MKRNLIILFFIFLTTSCAWLEKGEGQIVYHWAREKTSVFYFVQDHSECLRASEDMSWMPDIKSWFYSEEARYDIRADWHSEKGVWASYVPYAGAQPLVTNSLRDDIDVNPRKYRLCMEARGYWHRTYDIPTTTSIHVYKPQKLHDGGLRNMIRSNDDF